MEVENRSTISRGMQFLSESVDELKKISTPTRQETIQAAMVTVVIMVFIALCLFFFDVICNRLMNVMLS